MKEHKITNGFRNFCMYVAFTFSMARDVRRFLREEKMRESRMLFRL